MATEVIAGAVGEIRAASAANGTALTTTATFIQLPLNTKHITVTPRNFATAVVVRWNRNPWLVVLKTTDNMLGLPTDYSKVAQDADAATDVVVSSLGALADGDFLLIGSHQRFRGVYIDVDGTNGAGTATLAVAYWNGSAWVDVSTLSDGTNGGNRVFEQDGIVTWDVPTPWAKASLPSIYPAFVNKQPEAYYADVPLYWVRLSVSAALTDTAVTFNSLVAANRSTAYAELVSGQTWEEQVKHGEIGGIGCIEALTDAGTANLLVNVATRQGGEFA